MKKILVFFSPIILLACFKTTNDVPKNSRLVEDTLNVETDMHNAQNALDWSGIYMGLLPCADCEGIETTIILNNDLTYLKTENYLGEEGTFEEEGTFIWMNDGLRIALKHQNTSYYYKVQENSLLALDIDGNEISGEMALMYLLKKQ